MNATVLNANAPKMRPLPAPSGVWFGSWLAKVALWSACVATSSSCDAPTPPADTRPNIAVVLIDTLRVDNLSFYGYPHETTEFLSSLVPDSVLFTNAFSTSTWTAPATASLFTALYPLEHGVLKGFFAHRDEVEKIREHGNVAIQLNAMPTDSPTLPEVLKAAGYATFGVAANVNIGREMGFARGFDRFERIVGRGSAVAERSVTGSPDEDAAERVLETVRGWKQEIAEAQPHFIYLHFNDPHAPYRKHRQWYRWDTLPEQPLGEGAEAKPRHRQATVVTGKMRRYNSEIGYVDHVIGRVFEEFGFEKNTILAVVSDHGEAFGEKGRVGHGRRSGLIGVVDRMLFMLHAPDRQLAAARIENPVSIVDVAPTLLDLAGIAPMEGARSGRSLVPLFAPDAEDRAAKLAKLDARPLLLYVADRGKTPRPLGTRGVILDGWKLVDPPTGPELYHLAEDRDEAVNRAQSDPAVVARLAPFIDSAIAAPHQPRAVDLDADDLERLRALGYTESP